MSGAGAVTALVLLEWTVGWVAGAAWTQSWKVIRRGHFRIGAWGAVVLGGVALVSIGAALRGVDGGPAWALAVATVVVVGLYAVVQYSNTDLPGVVAGTAAGVVGTAALLSLGALVGRWPAWLAGLQLAVGAALLGAVTNGMMLGHWYLNQPGLKPWALARLTTLGLIASGAAAFVGVVSVGRLTSAATRGATLGLPGFGESFGGFFFVVWLVLVAFTSAVVWAARRCVRIRSIQSATGLYYVAILTAGVAQFLVTYLMVNS